MTTKDDCVFCKRIGLSEFDFEDAYAVSFEPLNPVVHGHRLFVPKMHLADAATHPEITGKVMEFAAKYASTSRADFNLITSAGQSATQSVFHLHIHYVPRQYGDNLFLPWTNQNVR